MSEHPGPPSFEPPAGSTRPQQPFGQPYPAASAQQARPTGAPQRSPEPRRGGAGKLVALVLAASLVGGGVGSLATLAATDRPQQIVQGETTTPVIESSGDAIDWAAVARSVEPAVVSINVLTGQGGGSEGSGVVLDTEGNIATNNHVIDGGRNGEINVTLTDNTIHRATIIGTDPGADLAVIRLEDPPEGLTPIAFGDVTELAVGDPVMAIGNPLGLSGSVTTGIVSALHRPVQSSSNQQQERSPFDPGANRTGTDTVVIDAIQTSAPINPGNSGGALVNAQGQLVGITSAIATLSGSSGQSGNIGIGFAIRSDQVLSVTSSIIETGSSVTPFLGVSTTDGIAEVDGASVVGAEIVEVTSGSPADEAGLREGDVVYAMDDVPITGSVSLAARVRSERAGDEVSLSLSRDGTAEQVVVTLAGR